MNKFIPILFSTPMVQAILEGRKSMTRREVKPELIQSENCFHWNKWINQQYSNPECSPYGKVGDILWVRETSLWVMRDHAHDLLEGSKDNNQIVYKASVNEDWFNYAKEKYNYKWKPSLFMPKDACRIFLKITNVRVERLADISPNDSIKEGIEVEGSNPWYKDYIRNIDFYPFANPWFSFRSLWISINGKDSWNANPWVWVIEFKRVEKPTNFC